MDDKADTVDAIVAASELPISVITAGLTAPVCLFPDSQFWLNSMIF